ncbi:MAG: flippase-like domain-containing protein [Anaerolineae bacterium]|nr:flippase-like domain-containing protein [Anaerolineae bacterium]
MQMRQRLLVLVGLLISALFLWVAFNGLHPAVVWEYIQRAQLGWLLVGAGVFYISMILIAWRWRFLLPPTAKIPLSYLTQLYAITYMGNNVYPLRAGEVLRVFLMQRDYQVPVARTSTTVFIERIFDGFVMLAFILVPLQFIDIESEGLRIVFTATTALFAVALAAFILFALKPDVLRALARFVARFLPESLATMTLKVSEDIIDGLMGLRSTQQLLGAVVGSVATWLFNALVYWLVGLAFDIHVGFLVMLVVCGAVNLAGVIPASPGQIGVFEASVKAVLTAVGVADDLALAYAFVVHVVIWLPPTLLGFILLVRRGLGLQAFARARQATISA